MYGMTPMGVFFTAIFPLKINEHALCQQLHYDAVDAASDFRACRFQYRNRYQAYQQYQLLDNETAP